MKKQWLAMGITSGILGISLLMALTRNGQSQEAPAPATVQTEKTVQTETQAAPVAPQAAQDTFEAMMGAIEDNNRAAFVAFADARFKAALTLPQFQALVDQIAPRLKGGHAFRYFGELNQAGFTTHLWRVRFEDGGDDFLASMSVKEEKVGGFFLR